MAIFDQLKEGWEDVVISMGAEGCSVTEIAVAIGIRRQGIYELIKESEDFADTFAHAKELANAWWEKQGRVNLENREFNNSLWSFNMTNRFREEWHNKQQVEHSGEIEGERQVIVLPSNDRAFEDPNQDAD